MKKYKITKKLLCLFLVFLVSIAPLLVSAEETASMMTEEDRLLEEKLEALGVIDVQYDNYDANVTKRQMAEIIVRFMNLRSAGTAQGKTPFTDVSTLDENLDDLVLLYQMGVITGDENYQFHPDNNVTYNEAMVFIVNAVGHKLFAVRNGGYPTGYLKVAIQLDLLDGISVTNGKDTASLRDIYKMLDAALHAGAVVEGGISGSDVIYYVSDTEDFLSRTYGINTYKGFVTGNENTHMDDEKSTLSDEQIAIDGKIYDTPGYAYGDLLGRSVKYYLYQEKGETAIAKYVEENENINSVTRVDAEDLILNKTTLTSVYYTNDEEKDERIDFVTNIKVIYNGRLYKNFGYLSNVLPVSGYIEALDNNRDGICEILFVNTYKNVIVESVDVYAGTITAKGSTVPEIVDTGDKNTKIYLYPDMKKLDLSKVHVGDVATIMESKGLKPIKNVYIVRDKVSGMITEYDNYLGYQIKGEYYKEAADYSGPALNVGMQATFCLDINGDLVDIDRSYVETDAAVGLITGLDYEFTSLEEKIEVRIYTAEGKFEIYPIRFPVKIDGTTYRKGEGDTVVQILSGNRQNSNSEYYIHDAYVVQYKLSGDAISTINTGSSMDVGQLRKIAEGSSFFVRNEKMMGLESSPHTGYASYRPGETLIFVCPAAGNLEETELYGMLNKLDSDREYIPAPSAYYQIKIDGYVMYDFNNNETKVAEVILLKGDGPLGGGVVTNSTPVGVVTDLTVAVDQDGEKTQKVYTNMSESAFFNETFTYKKGTTTATYTESTPLNTLIKVGDVIRYSTGVNGKIESVEVLTSYDNTNGFRSYFTPNASLGSSNAGTNLLYGKVVCNDVANGVLTYTVDDGTTEYMINTQDARVICYRADREKASEVEISAIAAQDDIVVRVQTYYKATEIIIFR